MNDHDDLIVKRPRIKRSLPDPIEPHLSVLQNLCPGLEKWSSVFDEHFKEQNDPPNPISTPREHRLDAESESLLVMENQTSEIHDLLSFFGYRYIVDATFGCRDCSDGY